MDGKDGSSFKVANFSIVKNDGEEKIYNNISAYGKKAEEVANYKKGDFISVFGKEKTSTGKDGKAYTSVQLRSTKLLKAKAVEKGSTIENIAKLQEEIKNAPKKAEAAKPKVADKEM
ncbi:MAG: single-stranded DNA-binding protein [Anaerorhabdus sp.]